MPPNNYTIIALVAFVKEQIRHLNLSNFVNEFITRFMMQNIHTEVNVFYDFFQHFL